MIVGSIGSALCFQNDTFSIYQQMAIWRFILGVGCGGEYPLGMCRSRRALGLHYGIGRIFFFDIDYILLGIVHVACPGITHLHLARYGRSTVSFAHNP